MCICINQTFIQEERHKDTKERRRKGGKQPAWMDGGCCACEGGRGSVCRREGVKAKANVTHSLWWPEDLKLCGMVS